MHTSAEWSATNSLSSQCSSCPSIHSSMTKLQVLKVLLSVAFLSLNSLHARESLSGTFRPSLWVIACAQNKPGLGTGKRTKFHLRLKLGPCCHSLPLPRSVLPVFNLFIYCSVLESEPPPPPHAQSLSGSSPIDYSPCEARM